MENRFTWNGLDLHMDEVHEVLDWVADPIGNEPNPKPMPACLRVVGYGYIGVVLRSGGRDSCRLTADIIDAMRDWAFPWTLVEWKDVEPGQMVRSHNRVGMLGGGMDLDGYYRIMSGNGYVHFADHRDHVEARRPRVDSVAVGDVRRGTVVKRVAHHPNTGVRPVRRVLGPTCALGHRDVLDETAWLTEAWHSDTQVEVIKEPDE